MSVFFCKFDNLLDIISFCILQFYNLFFFFFVVFMTWLIFFPEFIYLSIFLISISIIRMIVSLRIIKMYILNFCWAIYASSFLGLVSGDLFCSFI